MKPVTPASRAPGWPASAGSSCGPGAIRAVASVTTAAWWLVKNRSAGASAGDEQPADPRTAAEATAAGITASTVRRRVPPRSERPGPAIVDTRQV
jgi:hypothetical protein